VTRLRRPPRSFLVVAGAALLLCLVGGHLCHSSQTIDEAAVALGICFVAVAVAGVSVRTGPLLLASFLPRRLIAGASPVTVSLEEWPRARASPVWLQRSLN